MSADVVSAVVAEGLSCAVGGRTVLADVDLQVARGRMVAVVGQNGSGKSTLLRTVAGLLAPVAGSVHVAWLDVHASSARDRARSLAFVAQEERPPADMRVAELVALGRLPYRPPWSRGADDHRRALEALTDIGMAEAADRACADLSGGERRRVSLARGLVQDCDVVVLDEPTNHLDVRHQIDLLTHLRDSGRTVLAAIHDLGLAAGFFDHVVVLSGGHVAAQGPPHRALTPATIAETFGVDASFVTDDRGREHLVVGSGRTPAPTDTKETIR